MNTGNKNRIVVDENPSFIQQLTFPPLVFVENGNYFSSLNDSNSFGTVDCDPFVYTKTD